MNQPMKFALLGASAFASIYVGATKLFKNITLNTIYSRDIKRAENFARTHGIENYTDQLKNILENPAITAIIICTEPARHIELAKASLLAGKHVLIEKPLSANLKEAQDFLNFSKNYSNKVISVCSPKRFDPVLIQMKKALDNMAMEPAKIAHVSMLWARSDQYYRQGMGWKSVDGAVFVNQAIHWIDVCLWFFGEIEKVSSHTLITRDFLKCVDQGSAILEFKNKTQVLLSASAAMKKNYPDQFTIYGANEKIDYQTLKARNSLNQLVGKIYSRIFQRPSAYSNPLALQLEDFVHAIIEKKQPRTTLQNGYKALEVALSISG